jgi:hypothetical protein
MKKTLLIAAGFIVCAAIGCSQSSENQTADATSESAMPTEPAAKAAYNFFSAMIEGDTQQATNCLTPLAIQRIHESNLSLIGSGFDSGTFRIGTVRNPSPSNALVQCYISDVGPNGQRRNEEICCLLKLIEGRWLVTGIAYQPIPGGEPVIMSFENPDPPQQQAPSSFAESQDSQAPYRPSDPPATAFQPADYPVR